MLLSQLIALVSAGLLQSEHYVLANLLVLLLVQLKHINILFISVTLGEFMNILVQFVLTSSLIVISRQMFCTFSAADCAPGV